ncbi:MAG: hypothetical protein HY056_16965 [Proteobacteria bacterium]|nr:hypothetical protein [Pseudomonadota bacterium]
MTRIFGYLIVAIVLAAGNAQAEGKKKNPACGANFFDACMKRCIGAAGRQKLCPDYCARRKVELGC